MGVERTGIDKATGKRRGAVFIDTRGREARDDIARRCIIDREREARCAKGTGVVGNGYGHLVRAVVVVVMVKRKGLVRIKRKRLDSVTVAVIDGRGPRIGAGIGKGAAAVEQAFVEYL